MTQDRSAASSESLERLIQAMSGYRGQMQDCLAALCRVPSVSGPPLSDAPYGRETADALALFLDMGRRLGLRAVNLDNRAGYVEYGSGEKMVAVLGHLDVVPAGAGWNRDPFEPLLLTDRLVARGALDDKGPVVAALFAIKALADQGFAGNCRIRLIVGLDEEQGSGCMAHYTAVEELPAAGFTPDASFPVIYAEKGIAWVEVEMDQGQPDDHGLKLLGARGGSRPNMVPSSCSLSFAGLGAEDIEIFGQAAHASTPWEGQNAISLAMRQADDKLKAAGCAHPFVDFYQASIGGSWRGEGLGIASQDESGPLTLNAGLLDLSGPKARLTLDIRYPVTVPLQELEASLVGSAKAYGATAKVIKHLAPLYVPRDSALVSILTDTYRELTGLDASPVAIGGGTYARSMPGIVAFGPLFPGDAETAHQAGEYITWKTMLASAAIFCQALRRLAE